MLLSANVLVAVATPPTRTVTVGHVKLQVLVSLSANLDTLIGQNKTQFPEVTSLKYGSGHDCVHILVVFRAKNVGSQDGTHE